MATTVNPWDPNYGTTPNLKPGLMNSVPSGPTAAGVQGQESYGYTPTTRTVNQPTETVAGQFNALTKSDNPLMQMARTSADQQSNQRGLLNSSMAVGASDMAAYQAALPIAQADAATYGKVSEQNLGYSNEALKYDTAAQNEAAKANAEAGNKLTMLSQDNTSKAQAAREQQAAERARGVELAGIENAAKAQLAEQQATADRTTKLALANLDNAAKDRLAQLESEYKMDMQSSATTSEMYKQMVKNLSDISLNTTMTATAKQQATDNQITLFKDGMRLAGSIGNLNLASLLTFASPVQG